MMNHLSNIAQSRALLAPFIAALLTFAAWMVPDVAKAEALAEETVLLEEDQLAVTVASATLSEPDPLNSEMTIWVGEIELEGRKTVWVELIDRFGEVIYNSEVSTNETHLLPDGRAVVVRSIDPETRVAKADESRLESDQPMMVTRRVVDTGEEATSVEFIEASTTEAPKRSPMMELAAVGHSIWAAITQFVQGAADHVQVAWNWIVDTVRV